MAAPTPVSAYLHAAAMVKAGVYLVALLAPAFADSPGWRPIVLAFGAATMIIGGWRALRQYDLKLLLAYGTVSQLGFLIAICGLGTRSALLAGVAMLVSHALFKASLFLVVGIVDHSTGTRDLRQLSGVRRRLPVLAVAAALAAALDGGHPAPDRLHRQGGGVRVAGLPVAERRPTWIPPLAALLLARRWSPDRRSPSPTRCGSGGGHSPPSAPTSTRRAVGGHAGPCPGSGFAVAPVLLAGLSLVGGFLGPQLTVVLTPYADQAPVGEPSHGVALWHGFSVPLLMSRRRPGGRRADVRCSPRGSSAQATFPRIRSAEEVYQATMRTLDRVAVEITGRSQRGSLPIYLGSILLVVVVVPGFVLLTLPNWPAQSRLWDTPAQAAVAVVMIAAALLAASSRGRLKAVALLGVTGYGTAVLFLLHGAPDLALTQILVETVTLVVFVLVLRKLPKYFTDRPLHSSRWWRMAVAALGGLTVSGLVFVAAGSRTATPVSDAFYEAAYEFGYGRNIVNVTLVDTRAWDTMGEISVLVVAATGVASLIFIHRRYTPSGPRLGRRQRRSFLRKAQQAPPSSSGRLAWLRGSEQLSPRSRSIIFEVVTRLLFPIMILYALFLLFSGHNNPGGGFAGGLVAGMALMIRYLAGGEAELDEAAPVDPGLVLGGGLLTSALSMLAPVMVGGRIGQSYALDINAPYVSYLPTPWGEVTLLGEVHIVTSLVFDIGVFTVVVGVMLDLARSLGSGIDQQEAADRTPLRRVRTETGATR